MDLGSVESTEKEKISIVTVKNWMGTSDPLRPVRTTKRSEKSIREKVET